MICENNILITGGSGYVGQATYSLIPKAINADIRDVSFPIDLLSYENLYRYIDKNDIRYVLHLAAFKNIKESISNPTKYYHNNLLSSLNLFKVCEKLNLPMVFASSASVYYDSNPYSLSKILFENILKESSINYLILRYFNIGGLIQSPSNYQKDNVFDVIRNCLKLNELFYLNKNTFPRDYSHVLDVAEINVKALEMVAFKECRNTYDVCSGVNTSLKTILNLYSQKNIKINFIENNSLCENYKEVQLNRFPYFNKHNVLDIVESEIYHGIDKNLLL